MKRKVEQRYIRMTLDELALTLCALRYCVAQGRQDLRPRYHDLLTRLESFAC